MPSKTLPTGYNPEVEVLRETEYPHMKGVYLDHSGTTIYAKSTIDGFSRKMLANLFGNPHSENTPAKLSGELIDDIRIKLLRFLGADPEHFDLVFVANATAAIKLVADSFRDLAEKTRARSFWYGYQYVDHLTSSFQKVVVFEIFKDAHTSIVGVREFTYGQHHCYESDREVEEWLRHPRSPYVNRADPNGLGLFAYPGQSNMSGRRLPQSWPGHVRRSGHLQNVYTLFDAAALAMTSSLESVFKNVDDAPDFTCLSLYKIFGFPDLGALVVRKASGHILVLRKYFGGGTVSMVGTLGESWHRSKALETPTSELHDGLEDGTLPFHSIIALGEAISVHERLYGSMSTISAHTTYLVARLHHGLSSLYHPNGRPVCRIYDGSPSSFGDATRQGPVVAFNVVRANGEYVPYNEVEAMANEQSIYIRSGGVCNPGGIFTALGYEAWMTHRMLSAGHRCGGLAGISVIHRLPTGIVRASVGAMSTEHEVDTFIEFVRHSFIDDTMHWTAAATEASLYTPRSEIAGFDFPGEYKLSKSPFPDVREMPRPRPYSLDLSHTSLQIPRLTASPITEVLHHTTSAS